MTGHSGTGALASRGMAVQLIGMLDSPSVRCVVISLRLLGLRFEHRPGLAAYGTACQALREFRALLWR